MNDHLTQWKTQIDRIMQQWCPEFSRQTESFEIQMLRTILHFNAYDLDARRVLAGENPIRCDYPLPLPDKLQARTKP